MGPLYIITNQLNEDQHGIFEIFALVGKSGGCVSSQGEIIIKPITDDCIRNMAGITGTKGKLLRTLKEEKERERML